MQLYGTPPTRAARPLWVIKHLGLDCEVKFVSLLRGDQHKPEFLALNPLARLPVLVDGDDVVCESVAICLYLAEKDPEQRLIPSEPAIRAQMYRWLFFLTSDIEGPLDRIEKHTALYPEEKRSPEDVELAKEEGRKMCGVLESLLMGREFFVGDTFSVADIVAAYTLAWADDYELLDTCPELRAYVKRMYEMPTAPPTSARAYEALKAGPGDEIDWLGL